MKTSIIALVTVFAAVLAHAQSPITASGSYGTDRINDSVAARNIGAFSTSSTQTAAATFLATVEYTIDDINNDSDIQSSLYVNGGNIAHSVDRTPGANVSPRQSVMTLIGQAVLSPGTHSVVIQVGRIGSVDSYDIAGRWVCTVVRFGEASVALTNAVSALNQSDAAMQATLEAQINALAALAEEEIAQMRAQIDTLNAQIGDLQENAGHLQTRIEIQERFKDFLEAELDLVHFQIESLQAELAEHVHRLADHEARLGSVEFEVADLRDRLAHANDRIEHTQNALQETQSQLEGTQGALAETQSALAATQGSLLETQTHLQETQSSLQQTQSDLTGTQGVLSTVQGELGTTQVNLAGAQADILRLQEQALRNVNVQTLTNTNFRETIVSLRDRLANGNGRYQELQERFVNLPNQQDYNVLLRQIEQMPSDSDYHNLSNRFQRVDQGSDGGSEVGSYLIPIGASLGGSLLLDVMFNHGFGGASDDAVTTPAESPRAPWGGISDSAKSKTQTYKH